MLGRVSVIRVRKNAIQRSSAAGEPGILDARGAEGIAGEIAAFRQRGRGVGLGDAGIAPTVAECGEAPSGAPPCRAPALGIPRAEGEGVCS